MIFETFVDNLESGYKGDFSKNDLNEIRNFIQHNELTSDQIQNWYNVIRRKHKVQYLPVFGQLMEYWDEAKFKRSGNTLLHPPSPLQMLYKYQDKSAKWLIDKCAEIRRMQSKRELLGKEISFIMIWERLKDIIEHKQEEAKDKIIENGDNELYKPVDLSEWQIEYKPIKGIENKVNKIFKNEGIPF